jgi:hypothetical protein
MKKIITPLLLFVSTIFFSCDGAQSRKFNDKLVNLQKEIINKSEEMMKGSNEAENKKKVRDFVSIKLEELKKINPVKGGEAFKQAMVDDINALLQVYVLAVKIDDKNTSPTDAIGYQKEQQDWLEKINTLDNDVMEEQKKFAKEKGFKLEYK